MEGLPVLEIKSYENIVTSICVAYSLWLLLHATAESRSWYGDRGTHTPEIVTTWPCMEKVCQPKEENRRVDTYNMIILW